MRYVAVWFFAVIVIYNGLTDAGYYGPETSLLFVPFWSVVLSCGVVVAATLLGFPIVFAAVSRLWYHTIFGRIVAAGSAALGCLAMWRAYAAGHDATFGEAMLALSGLIAVGFAVIYCPELRKA
jgi:hypothetical protein